MVKGQRLALLVAAGALSTAMPTVARTLAEAEGDATPPLERSESAGPVAELPGKPIPDNVPIVEDARRAQTGA